MKSWMHFLGGSCAVYLAMAACAGGGSKTPTGSEANAGGRDDLTDPVPAADAATATSGTRLRARYHVGDDGSKQFVGWRDTERDEDCSFQTAEDGKLRCLPSTGGSVQYFSDSGCSEVVALVPATEACPEPGVAGYLGETSADCGAGRRKALFKVGSESDPKALYAYAGDGCVETTIAGEYRVFETTAVDPSDFVAATEQVD